MCIWHGMHSHITLHYTHPFFSSSFARPKLQRAGVRGKTAPSSPFLPLPQSLLWLPLPEVAARASCPEKGRFWIGQNASLREDQIALFRPDSVAHSENRRRFNQKWSSRQLFNFQVWNWDFRCEETRINVLMLLFQSVSLRRKLASLIGMAIFHN